MNDWPPVEIDGFTGVNVVSVPVFAPVADIVAAAADRMGFKRSTLLHIVVGLGLAMIEQHGPPRTDAVIPNDGILPGAPSVPPPPADEEA